MQTRPHPRGHKLSIVGVSFWAIAIMSEASGLGHKCPPVRLRVRDGGAHSSVAESIVSLLATVEGSTQRDR